MLLKTLNYHVKKKFYFFTARSFQKHETFLPSECLGMVSSCVINNPDEVFILMGIQRIFSCMWTHTTGIYQNQNPPLLGFA